MEDKTSASLMTIISIVRAFERESDLNAACVVARAQGASPNMVLTLAAQRLAVKFSADRGEERICQELQKIVLY